MSECRGVSFVACKYCTRGHQSVLCLQTCTYKEKRYIQGDKAGEMQQQVGFMTSERVKKRRCILEQEKKWSRVCYVAKGLYDVCDGLPAWREG